MAGVIKEHRFRAISAQAIAVMVKNLLLLDLGVSHAFPVILIPALTGLNSATNPNETIRITGDVASWLGSTLTILIILGSLLSGLITEPMGRKRAMLFVNIPHLLGWFLLYFSTSLTDIFIGMSLLGLGVGLMEAPIITYVGEICEPSVRDVMISSSGISASFGFLLVFIFGSIFNWRTVALLSSCIPITALLTLSFIPETPIWLLSRNRDKDATKALQWLRGWVPEQNIQEELNNLKRYREYANSCTECQLAELDCSHPPPTITEKIKSLFHTSYMKPMLIIAAGATFTSFAGAHHLNPYMLQILNTYQTPVDPNSSTMLFGLTSFIGTIACVLVAKFITKRSLYLISILGAAILNLWLGFHGLYYLPPNSKSFEHANTVNSGENATYIPLILVVTWRFLTNALLNVPVMYSSELFPLKSRCIAAGVSQAISNALLFIAIKTFYDLENWMNMSVTFFIYGVIAIIGLYVCYKIFPVTEDRSLQDIEKHYSDNKKKLTDWKIAPSSNTH